MSTQRRTRPAAKTHDLTLADLRLLWTEDGKPQECGGNLLAVAFTVFLYGRRGLDGWSRQKLTAIANPSRYRIRLQRRPTKTAAA